LESRELIPGGPAGAAVRIRGFRFAAQRGFTLLEVMIVVVIIGILVVGAILSLGSTGKDSGLEQERDRLSALVAYGRERGAMLTLEYGIRCGQHGYRFVFYDNRLMRWAPETLDDTLHPRKLPSGLRLDLTIEGHPIVLADNALKVNPIAATPPGGTVSPLGSSSGIGAITGTAGLGALSSSGGLSGGLGSGFTGLGGGLNNQPDNDMPQIMLFSNGDTNSFVLTMVREGVNRSVTLQSSDDGSVKVGDIIEPKQ
jgi:type II secretion system protein H